MTERERIAIDYATAAVEHMPDCPYKTWALDMLDSARFPGTPTAYGPVPRKLGGREVAYHDARTFRANGVAGRGYLGVPRHGCTDKPVYRPSVFAFGLALACWIPLALLIWWIL